MSNCDTLTDGQIAAVEEAMSHSWRKKGQREKKGSEWIKFSCLAFAATVGHRADAYDKNDPAPVYAVFFPGIALFVPRLLA